MQVKYRGILTCAWFRLQRVFGSETKSYFQIFKFSDFWIFEDRNLCDGELGPDLSFPITYDLHGKSKIFCSRIRFRPQRILCARNQIHRTNYQIFRFQIFGFLIKMWWGDRHTPITPHHINFASQTTDVFWPINRFRTQSLCSRPI